MNIAIDILAIFGGIVLTIILIVSVVTIYFLIGTLGIKDHRNFDGGLKTKKEK